jgi:hypothetical protein
VAYFASAEVSTGWQLEPDPLTGVDAIAVEPTDPQQPLRFHSNLVLTGSFTGGLCFSDWQNGTEELLPRMLDDYLLVDLEHLDGNGNGNPAGRRLAHHTGPGGQALTMEQWFTQIDDVGYTLTATVETVRYDELADILATAAASWTPPS